MADNIDEIVLFMVRLAQKAGKIQLDHYDGSHQVIWEKGHLITEVDQRIGEMVWDEISRNYSDFGILSEHLPPKKGDMGFIIDELDGTNPYYFGFCGHFCFSIGLRQGNELIAGVVYAPARNEMYVGYGGWAVCNGIKIRVSDNQDPSKAWMTFSSGKENRDSHIPFLQRAMSKNCISGTVEFGSTATTLCLVAAGKLHAFLGTAPSLEDVAGAVPILRAAGAEITNKKGEPWCLKDTSIFTANPQLHRNLSRILEIGQ